MSSGISEEGGLRKLLEQMNSGAPSQRRRLSDLLMMSEPCYVDKKGRSYVFGRPELETIRDALNGLGVRDVRLPIVLIADAGHSQSTWRVEGETECALISKLLGRPQREPQEKLFLYAPHVAELRRILPTATTCIFIP